jgi:hypothetical protein
MCLVLAALSSILCSSIVWLVACECVTSRHQLTWEVTARPRSGVCLWETLGVPLVFNQSINVTPVAMKLKKLMPAIH